MYEAWLGSPKSRAISVVRTWKLIAYGETEVSQGTLYWLNQGYDDYFRIDVERRLGVYPK